MPRTDLHKIEPHLRSEVAEVLTDLLITRLGSHERMILTEQFDTLRRFLDHPHITERQP